MNLKAAALELICPACGAALKEPYVRIHGNVMPEQRTKHAIRPAEQVWHPSPPQVANLITLARPTDVGASDQHAQLAQSPNHLLRASRIFPQEQHIWDAMVLCQNWKNRSNL